ncbi:hypothetical Protein YC6258_04152 [Gynuella sunshinyii YC6258]|uniref:Uncharacterized protein n=1 Tax=Gynuella sunshinyii YC6258 TaxID=1445510 RepID=A0A0C5VS85_9GAMM|nr:hypothetical Protein YC6258_04152 [Gynuella sunshinyii YC6258]
MVLQRYCVMSGSPRYHWACDRFTAMTLFLCMTKLIRYKYLLDK